MKKHSLKPFPMTLLVCSDDKELQRWRKKHRGEDVSESEMHVMATTFYDEACATIMVHVSKDEEYEKYHIMTPSHEASHAADALWEHIGESNPGDEVKAYMIGYMTDLIYKEFE